MDKSRYPADWNEISAAIRARAGDKCEQCGVANGAEILRLVSDPARYYLYDPESAGYTLDGVPVRLSEMDDQDPDKPHTTVVLTVHHIGIDKPNGEIGDPRDKMDCREDNLICLCQRCHLLADQPLHVAARRRTRNNKRAEALAAAGQQKLF